MATITITQPELDCVCGHYQRVDAGDAIKCPSCGRMYEVVCYLLEIDEDGSYVESEE